MWDPRNYRDTDFGLDPDESFEPDEFDEPEIDTATEPHVMTVLGPVAPEDLGICLPAEDLHQSVGLLEELTSLVTAGAKSVVDLPRAEESGRLALLRSVATRVPLHIIASAEAPQISSLARGAIQPGLLRASGTSPDLPLAIEASRESGLPLFVQDIVNAAIPEGPIVAVFEDVPPPRAQDQLLQQNSFILIAGVGRSAEQDRKIATWLVQATEDGFGEQLMISQRFTDVSTWHANGGQPGLVHLLERFVLEIMEAGGGAPFVRSLLIDNPARALTITPRKL